MNLSTIADYLDTLLNTKSYSSDSNGLVVSGHRQVTKVAGTVNLSWSSIRSAVKQGFEVLFSHHAAWKSTDAELSEEKYAFARKEGLSIYVAHDSLDNNEKIGTSITLARILHHEVVSFFADGMGVIVQVPKDLTFRAFEMHVRKTINGQALGFVSHPSVEKLAIIAGWGARPEWMSLAHYAGADTFLSGEGIHFGKLYALETDLNLVLAGHYATEAPAVANLMHQIASELGVTTDFIADHKSNELF